MGHDEAIDFEQTVELIGDRALAERVRDVSLAVYGAIADHARERGVILADTKFEFGLDPAGTLVLGDEVCTPDSSRFWPADEYEPGRGQASFDKQYVRDWAAGTGWDKAPPAPPIPDDVVAATRERYVTAYERLAGEPFSAFLERVGATVRARVLIRPKAGILDPQGQTVERALPALGFEGVANVHVGRLVELDVEDLVAAGRDVRAAADEPPHRGLRDPVAGGRRQMKIGVVRFPGSCDEVDALQAAQRVGDAELLWYADHDLRGADAVIIPGGFSYGDYLRVGAIARFAPVMEEVERFARAGGPVLGICNGFQVLCEAGLLPGALLPNTSLRFLCRQVGVTVASADTAWTRDVRAGRAALDPGQAHDRPLLRARAGARRARGASARSRSATRPARTRTARLRDIAGVSNQAGNVVGLMPHPEHAVDPLTGSEDGIALFRSVVGAAAALAA